MTDKLPAEGGGMDLFASLRGDVEEFKKVEMKQVAPRLATLTK